MLLKSENRSRTKNMRSFRWIALFLLAALACLAQGNQALGNQTKKDDQEGDKAKPATPARPEGIGQPVDPASYVLGGDDIIFISVWRQKDWTGNAAVRPDGKISLPLVGEIQAGGKTPDVFAKDLGKALSAYVNNPEVSVQVLEVRSKRYFIDGEVGHAGEFPLMAPIRVLEALSKAGGFRDFANRKKIKILRKGETFNFNWEEVTKGKKIEQNIFLENGDHIIVK